jgi:hypothetical protein
MSSRSKENVHILFESVFAIYDFWDGPRTGIAEFMNAPHFFECVFDQDKDEWSNSFFLIPLGPEAFAPGKRALTRIPPCLKTGQSTKNPAAF